MNIIEVIVFLSIATIMICYVFQKAFKSNLNTHRDIALWVFAILGLFYFLNFKFVPLIDVFKFKLDGHEIEMIKDKANNKLEEINAIKKEIELLRPASLDIECKTEIIKEGYQTHIYIHPTNYNLAGAMVFTTTLKKPSHTKLLELLASVNVSGSWPIKSEKLINNEEIRQVRFIPSGYQDFRLDLKTSDICQILLTEPTHLKESRTIFIESGNCKVSN